MEDCKIIPEEQAGFKSGRSCLDQIFTITTVLQSKIRLTGNAISCIFIDFSRAFDSVPHSLLWKKLFKLEISGKTIRTVKSIYEEAKILLRVDGNLSREFEITEGVLQGDKLSPTLYILYIADIIDFLQSKKFKGVSIGSRTSHALLFADNAVIFSTTIQEIRKILTALEEYFDDNKLSVHTGKTQIMIARASGTIRKKELNAFRYKGKEIKTTTNYRYLGINIDSATKGNLAAQTALSKAKTAIGTACSILTKARSDAWNSRIQLFDSLVAPTIFYGAESWGLDHLETIDIAQTDFFKRILLLAPNTPAYLIRLEIGATNLSVTLLERAWDWIIRILRMEDDRWPKICLLNLIKQLNNPNLQTKYNWAAKFNKLIKETNLPDIFANLDSNLWEKYSPDFHKAILKKLKIKTMNATFAQHRCNPN